MTMGAGILFVLEFQTKPDSEMSLRMMVYNGHACLTAITNHSRADSVLPKVLQVVLYGGNMTVRQRAHDIEGRGGLSDGDPAFEQGSQPLHESGGPLGEVGEGTFLDLAGVAIGFTQEHGRG